MIDDDALYRSRLLLRVTAKTLPRYVLISAPSGYGKTLLAEQIIQLTQLPTVRHRVTRLRKDAIDLHDESLRQFRALCPPIVEDVPNQPGTRSADYALHLLKYIERNLTEPFIYFLDDVHWLEDTSAAQAWLETLIQMWPEHGHLILAGHRLPEIGSIAIAAKGEAAYQIFQEEQLRFTDQETEELADQYEITIDAGQLTQAFDGWPAGIAAKTKTLALGAPDTGRYHVDPHTEFDYLARQLFDQQTDTIQEALLQTAVVPVFSAAICEEALGLPHMDDVLQDIDRRNLFVYRLADGYRYQDLFRATLLQIFKDRDVTAYRHLQRCVAKWQAQNGRYGESFWHFLEADDVPQAEATLKPHVHDYYREGRWQLLIQANEATIDYHHNLPELHLVNSMMQLEYDELHTSQANLERARIGYDQENDRDGIIKADNHQAFIWQRTERYDEAITLLNHVLARKAVPDNLKGWALRIRGNCRAYLEDFAGALEDFAIAEPLYRATGDLHSYANFLQDYALLYNMLGDWDAAQTMLARCINVFKQIEYNAHGLTHAYNNLGYLYYLVSDYEQASNYLDEGLRLSQSMNDNRGEAVISWTFGDLQRDLGAHQRARRFYDMALLRIGKLDRPLRHKILLNRARLAFWSGRWNRAFVDTNTVLHDTSDNAGSIHHVAQLMNTLTATIREDLQPNEALLCDQFTLLEECTVENTWVVGICLYTSLVYGMVALQERVEQWIERYMQANIDYDYKRHQRYPQVVQSLAADIINNECYENDIRDRMLWQWYIERCSDHQYGRLVEAVDKLRPNQVKKTPILTLTSAKPIKLLLLGDSTIVRDGMRVPPSEWNSAQARHLLAYMVMEQGNRDGFRQDELIDALWPDDNPAERGTSFTTVVSRARKVIGHELLPYDDEHKLYKVEMTHIRSDAQFVKDKARTARANPPYAGRTRDMWEQVVDCYQGDFLPKQMYLWAVKHRDECRHYYQQAILAVAQYAEAQGDPNTALNYYQRGIQKLKEDEVLYRHIMSWYGRKGNRNRVKFYYKRLKKQLRTTFGEGASVQPETQAIYDRMML